MSKLIDIDREIGFRRLHDFVRLAWTHVETVPFQDNWHIRLICEHLEAVERGELTKLVINVPPGCSKSLLVCVFFPVWSWIRQPDTRFMCASYDGNLSLRDARRSRGLIESPWFQARWGDIVRIDRGKNKSDSAGLYHIGGGGTRFSTSVGGRGVGWHAHVQLIDDPVKPMAVNSASRSALDNAKDWLGGTMASRKADASRFAQIIIMQRLHEDDPAGHCVADGWHHLCLPMRYESDHIYRDQDDPRIDGELLHPSRYSATDVASLERAMGPLVASAQLQQRPSPPGGHVFQRPWMSHMWTELPDKGVWIQSWDHTFGSTSDSASYVVGQVWLRSGANTYLVDQFRDRVDFPGMLLALETLSARYPQTLTKVFEGKASGPALAQFLKDKVPGIVLAKADSSTGGKLSRANAVTGLYAAGNVLHPHPTDAMVDGRRHPCPWVGELIERFVRFTGAPADIADEIDAASQGIAYLHGSSSSRFGNTIGQISKKGR